VLAGLLAVLVMSAAALWWAERGGSR